jgi:hypothetical protein
MHKNITIFNLFSLFLILLLSSSCSIEKRTYNKGYSINFKHFNHKYSLEEKTKTVKSREVKDKSKFIEEKIELTTSALLEEEKLSYKTLNDSNSTLNPCDWILYKDGTEIEAKVIEISDEYVKFKKCDYLDGPTYSKKISDIFMIKYRNGKKEIFNQISRVQEPKVENNPPPNSGSNYSSTEEIQNYNEDPSGYSILSFVFSLFSLFVPVGAILFALAGLVLGIIGINNSLKGLAAVGIILSLLTIFIIISIL